MRRLPLAIVVGIAACGREAPGPLTVAAAPPPGVTSLSASAVPARPPWVMRKVVTDAVPVAGGRRHTVKAGETGIAIARAYGVPWSTVVAANHLKAPFTIEIGDQLLLPSARAVAAQSPAERAKAFTIDIDDLITGGEPATGNLVGGGPAAAYRRSSVAPAKPARQPAPAPATSGSVARPPRAAAATSTAARPSPAMERPPAVAAPPPAVAITAPTGPTPLFAWPLEGRVLSGFGAKPGGRYNDGVNLKASTGTPVRAAADGVVAYAGDAVAGFGNLILIKHADGWVSAYGHNATLLVARGQKVAKGDIVARSGATGAVDEPQLHFELRRGRTASDPLKLLPPRL